MSSKSSYTYEKLFEAMHALSLGRGDIRSRLEDAYRIFYVLRPEDFPVEFRKDWKWVKNQMTRFGPVYKLNGEELMTSVHHTMRKIRNNTGVTIAEKIFDLFFSLNSQYYGKR